VYSYHWVVHVIVCEGADHVQDDNLNHMQIGELDAVDVVILAQQENKSERVNESQSSSGAKHRYRTGGPPPPHSQDF
jgi:hypothetical protein